MGETKKFKVTQDVYIAIKKMFREGAKLKDVKAVSPFGFTTLKLIKKADSFAHYKLLRTVMSNKNAKVNELSKVLQDARESISLLEREVTSYNKLIDRQAGNIITLRARLNRAANAGFIARVKYLIGSIVW